ncbi:unnamed protein product [Boreogadus saida]
MGSGRVRSKTRGASVQVAKACESQRAKMIHRLSIGKQYSSLFLPGGQGKVLGGLGVGRGCLGRVKQSGLVSQWPADERVFKVMSCTAVVARGLVFTSQPRRPPPWDMWTGRLVS